MCWKKILCYLDISHQTEIERGGEMKELYIERCLYCGEVFSITTTPPRNGWDKIRFPVDK